MRYFRQLIVRTFIGAGSDNTHMVPPSRERVGSFFRSGMKQKMVAPLTPENRPRAKTAIMINRWSCNEWNVRNWNTFAVLCPSPVRTSCTCFTKERGPNFMFQASCAATSLLVNIWVGWDLVRVNSFCFKSGTILYGSISQLRGIRSSSWDYPRVFVFEFLWGKTFLLNVTLIFYGNFPVPDFWKFQKS